MIYDMHLHSVFSDGIYEPEEVVIRAEDNNIKCLSLTDHDTVGGVLRAKAICERRKIGFIPGIEITCKEEDYLNNGFCAGAHLLGYSIDVGDNPLTQRLEQRRLDINKSYIELLRQIHMLGHDISIKDIPISFGTLLQLRDIKSYVKKTLSYSPRINEIISLIDNWGSEFLKCNIPISEAINLIHAAGGTAVLAHPFGLYKNFTKHVMPHEYVASLIKALSLIRLDGVEAYYLKYSSKNRAFLAQVAENNNLFITCGSDFHGFPGRENMINFDF